MAQKRAIQLNLEKGQTYFHHVHSESEIFQRSNGKISKSNLIFDAMIRYKVNSVKKEVYTIESQYLNMLIEVTGGDGKKYTLQSDPSSGDLISQIYYELCQTPFYIEMTKFGEIKEVNGIDKMVQNAIHELPISSNKKEKLKTELESTYGEQAFKGNFEIITLIYPKTLVDMNEAWQTETRLLSKQLKMDAHLLNSYRWTGSSENSVVVEGSSKLLSDELSENDELKKVDGSSTIYMELDDKTGWVRTATVHQTMRIGNKEEDGYSFTKLKTTYTDH